MVEVKVNITNKELDALEDVIVCWNLCKKHNAVHDATEEEMFAFTQNCKKCEKLNKELRGKALHLWSKLVTAYLKYGKKGKPKK